MGNKKNSSKSSNMTLIENSEVIKVLEEKEKKEKKEVTNNIRKSITEKGKLITNRIFLNN